MRLPFRAGLALALAGLLVSSPLYAQEAAPAPRPWGISCNSVAESDDLRCVLSQTVIAGETGQRIIAASIARRDGAPLLTLALPHGLRLPEGVEIFVDEAAPSRHPILTADQNGSYAEIALEEQLLGALRAGQALNVAVTSLGGDRVTLQLSLIGFSAAYARI